MSENKTTIKNFEHYKLIHGYGAACLYQRTNAKYYFTTDQKADAKISGINFKLVLERKDLN